MHDVLSMIRYAMDQMIAEGFEPNRVVLGLQTFQALTAQLDEMAGCPVPLIDEVFGLKVELDGGTEPANALWVKGTKRSGGSDTCRV